MTTCQVCGGEVTEDESIVLVDRRVCRACKSLIVEQLKEGGVPPALVGETMEVDDHEFGFGELLWKTWEICRRDWPILVGLELLGAIPAELFQAFLFPAPSVQHPTPPFPLVLASIGFGQINVVAAIAIAWVVNERVAGRSLSPGEALSKAVRRWLPAIGTNLLMLLAIVVLLALLIVPGIIFLGYYNFVDQAVALRGRAWGDALDYSMKLVKGRWWRVVAKTYCLSLPTLVPIGVLRILTPHLPQSLFVSIPHDLLIDVMNVYVQVGTVLFFLNLDALARKAQITAKSVESESRASV